MYVPGSNDLSDDTDNDRQLFGDNGEVMLKTVGVFRLASFTTIIRGRFVG